MTTKPAEVVTLSANDVRRILAWAQKCGANEIGDAEQELAKHVALINVSEVFARQTVYHEWAGASTMKQREMRCGELQKRLADQRATFARLMQLITQSRNADNERAAQDIVEAVLANRRDEKREQDRKKTVDNQ